MSLPIVSRSPSCLRVLIDLVDELAPEDKAVVPKFDLTEPSDEERGAAEPVTAGLYSCVGGIAALGCSFGRSRGSNVLACSCSSRAGHVRLAESLYFAEISGDAAVQLGHRWPASDSLGSLRELCSCSATRHLLYWLACAIVQ